MATFGRDTEKLLFRHEAGATFLNHGSWGSVPRPVYDERLRLLDEQESAPDRWFRWRVADLWTDNLEAACRFVGAQFHNTAFVHNATTAVNTVLKALPLKAGDAILVYSWTHHAVRNICDATAQRTGAKVLSVDIKIPIKSRHDVVAQYREMLDTHPNVKIAMLELISSPTATVMPYMELSKLCRERGVLVLLDGAHGPGQVALNLEELGQGGVDFFTGNFHKWVYATRGCAILWVHPKHHKVIRPVTTGHNFNHEIWQEDFMTQGTADNTAYYTCRKATEFYEGIGGMEAIVGYNSQLADEAVALLTAAWGTGKFPIPKDMEAPCMRVVRLPDLTQFPVKQDPETVFGDMLPLIKTLADRFRIYAVTLRIHGELWVRISSQVYNSLDDYRKLADAILTLQQEGVNQNNS